MISTLTTTLQGQHYLHLTEEKTEAHKGYVTAQSHKATQKSRCEPRSVTFKSMPVMFQNFYTDQLLCVP